jgi:hypothetical protein
MPHYEIHRVCGHREMLDAPWELSPAEVAQEAAATCESCTKTYMAKATAGDDAHIGAEPRPDREMVSVKRDGDSFEVRDHEHELVFVTHDVVAAMALKAILPRVLVLMYWKDE